MALLCAACRSINIQDLRLGLKHELKCAEVIKSRIHCHLCNALYKACLKDAPSISPECYLYLKEEGTDSTNLSRGLISWNGQFGVHSISEELAQPPAGSVPIGCLRIFATDDCALSVQQLLPGRPVLDPACDTTIRKVQSWLNNCVDKHSACRVAISGERPGEDASAIKLPTRVIDVSSPARVHISNGQCSRYLALSYCWGDALRSMDISSDFMLRKNTIEAFQQSLPVDRLPKTIQDAILVTRRLGFKYLWVDCLCIIQDCEEDWLFESQNMGRLFQNATCTLAATAAENSTEGLFTRSYTDFSADVTQSTGPAVRIPCRSLGKVIGEMYVSRMTGEPPPWTSIHCFEAELQRSSWNHRAWVVQERLLARRVLHFGQTQLFFECQTEVLSETSAVPVRRSHQSMLQSKHAIMKRLDKETSLANLLTSRSTALRSLRAMAVVSYDTARHWTGLVTNDETSDARVRFWGRVVKEYNATAITRQNDKLIAILGLATMLSSRLRLTYCAGLWIEDIARSLFWWADIDDTGLLYSLPDSEAPSWSWAAWQGSIRTATFISDLYPGRPRVIDYCDKTQQTDAERSFLKIVAHCWEATLSNMLESRHRAKGWTVPWTPPISSEPLDPFDVRVEVDRLLHVQHPTYPGQVLEGRAQLDDFAFDTGKESPCVCMVLHESRIHRSAEDGLAISEHAFGYHLLLLQPSQQVRGAFTRIGVGVCVSLHNSLTGGWWSRAAPKTELLLI